VAAACATLAGVSARILIVEDDAELARLLAEYLHDNGYRADVVGRGDEAVVHITQRPPDVVILDLMLPGLDGVEVCRRVRPGFAGGIIMLTARKGDVDEVLGLELGADDFVTKPAYPRVLLARIRSLLRRLEGGRVEAPSSARCVGRLSLDRPRRVVLWGATPLKLTTIEFDVLWILAAQPGESVTRDRLYREVLESEWDGLDRGMDIHVSRIRQKLVAAGGDPAALRSMRGSGYLLAVQ
jgi:two-component system response regulator RstA